MTGEEIARKIAKLERENTRLAGLYWHLNRRVREDIALCRRRLDELEARLDAETTVERVRSPEKTPTFESELT